MKRRDVLQKIVIGTGAIFILPPVIVSCSDDPDTLVDGNNGDGNGNTIEIDLDNPSFAELKTVGGYIINSGIIIANLGNETFVALSSTCTHQGCTISYNAGRKEFPCPCHGSVFDNDGSVINGPATNALKEYTVTRTGNILILS